MHHANTDKIGESIYAWIIQSSLLPYHPLFHITFTCVHVSSFARLVSSISNPARQGDDFVMIFKELLRRAILFSN